MTMILPTLAVAFAAFCVWLTVRIVNRREPLAIAVGLAIVLTAISAAAATAFISLSLPD